MNPYLKYWLPIVAWSSVIFWFSERQVQPAAEIIWQDFIIKKTAHVIEYAIFFVFLYRALKNTTRLTDIHSAVVALTGVVVYGMSDEFHQSFTPGREPHVRDIIIDTLGGGLAWLILWKLIPKMPEKLKKWAESLELS